MHKLKTRFTIFCLIGIINTLVDIFVYYELYNVTRSIILANLVATSIALGVSYILNSKFTFKAKHWPFKRLILFIGVTVFSLWVLQTYLIYTFTYLLHVVHIGDAHLHGGLGSAVVTLSPKLLATGVTFIWNFLWYNKVIFRNAHQAVNVGEPLVI